MKFTNSKHGSLRITSVDFPQSISGCFEATDVSPWQKEIKLKFKIAEIDKSVKSIDIRINVQYDDNITEKFAVRCIYAAKKNLGEE